LAAAASSSRIASVRSGHNNECGGALEKREREGAKWQIVFNHIGGEKQV
jgi:hypothetical protein